MHTDLASHLHTPECNALIEQLKNCHSENTFGKFLGFCNKIDSQLVQCLRNERKANQKANYLKSVDRQKKLTEALKSAQ